VTTSSKRKGDAAELEIARILADQLGFRVRRKLGAGRMDDEGDIDGLVDTTVEVKFYANVSRGVSEAIKDLEREHANSGHTFAVAFVKRPRAGWVAVSTVEQWCAMYREATSPP
jgi:Holliday junction resolvase